MRKATVAALIALILVVVTGAAYAHMNGKGGAGRGMGSSECGKGPGWDAVDKKVLDETLDLRKEMHSKRFDLMEAQRAGNTEKADSLEKELDGLREKLFEKTGPIKGKGTAKRGGCGGPCDW